MHLARLPGLTHQGEVPVCGKLADDRRRDDRLRPLAAARRKRDRGDRDKTSLVDSVSISPHHAICRCFPEARPDWPMIGLLRANGRVG
jgi:hypothetical protein